MGSLSPTIQIAMLNADVPIPNVLARYKSYGSIFHILLCDAASRTAPHVNITSTDFNIVLGEYPKALSDFDAIIVSGSASSSYDDAEWIHRLNEYLATTYQNYPKVKIFGSCFGHQIICQSLLGKSGCIVEKDPKGWELGVHGIQLTDEFRAAFPSVATAADADQELLEPGPEVLRLQFIHTDHVRLPPKGLPGSWVLVGATKHCAVQGVYEPGRVLTYQGHFEFDRFVNTETIKIFGAMWKPEKLKRALELMDQDDDAKVAAEMVLRFLLERNVK
ncbi:Fc.00g048130.m01.CDS01 [Cosmosporella sp. VM-42]